MHPNDAPDVIANALVGGRSYVPEYLRNCDPDPRRIVEVIAELRRYPNEAAANQARYHLEHELALRMQKESIAVQRKLAEVGIWLTWVGILATIVIGVATIILS